MRGSLLVCGRPDGRLTALTTAEASVCLAVNQASSIQSIGGTCESITIGHNPSKLPLSKDAIFLDMCRPKFLCEKMLDDMDEVEATRRRSSLLTVDLNEPSINKQESLRNSAMRRLGSSIRSKSEIMNDEALNASRRSSASLLGKNYFSLPFRACPRINLINGLFYVYRGVFKP